MIDLNTLRKSKGYVLAIVNTKTGEYNPVHGDVREVILCKDCKHWDRYDKVFCDFDGKEWHGCKMLDCFTSASGDPPMTPEYFYCGDGERKEE